MIVLQRLLIALTIALIPLQLSWAGQAMTPADMTDVGAVSSTMIVKGPDQADARMTAMPAECCEDGNHPSTVCHVLPVLLEAPAIMKRPNLSAAGHPRPVSEFSDGRAPSLPLRPPTLA